MRVKMNQMEKSHKEAMEQQQVKNKHSKCTRYTNDKRPPSLVGERLDFSIILDHQHLNLTLFRFSPQSKNRELMKQVAALSKGKKFDRTGSSLLLP